MCLIDLDAALPKSVDPQNPDSEAALKLNSSVGMSLMSSMVSAAGPPGNLPQHYAQLQYQLAMMTQNSGGSFPQMGQPNPFSSLTPQQVSTPSHDSEDQD